MVVCKFYLQGTCRFGENCKFEHPINTSSLNASGASILRSQNFNMPPATQIDTNTLVRSLTNDMVAAEKGGQWLLSSYAPFKDKPPFPGFEDQSFEEVRCSYYEAQRNGTLDQHKQQFQNALQEAAMKIKALQNPSNEAIAMLKGIYDSSPLSGTRGAFNNNPPVYNIAHNTPVQSTGGGFVQNQPSKSIFGQNTQNTSSPFGQQQSQSVFAAANQSLFGHTNQTNQSAFGSGQQSIFGAKPTFNTQQSSGSLFSNQSQTSMFGQNAPTNQQSIFGAGGNSGQTSVFNVQQPKATVFGNQTQQLQNSIFSQPPQQSSVFAPAQSTRSLFVQQTSNTAQPAVAFMPAQPQNTYQQQAPIYTQLVNKTEQPHQMSNTVFGQQVPTGNIFHGVSSNTAIQPPTSNVFSSGASVFGNTQNTTAQLSVFGQSTFNNEIDESAYSKIEDLNESDIKSFECDNFQFGKIPELPPTFQMCK